MPDARDLEAAPYHAPVLERRRPAEEARPDGGGLECFETAAALALNEARLRHLASLDLPVTARHVLEVGAGVGHLTGFFIERGCTVMATEARAENVAALRTRRPEADVREADVEAGLDHLGRFDVVFC